MQRNACSASFRACGKHERVVCECLTKWQRRDIIISNVCDLPRHRRGGNTTIIWKEYSTTMRTRTIVLVLVTILLVSVIAACGAAPTPTALPTATKAPVATATTAPAAAPTATKAPAAAATTAPSTASAPAIPHTLTDRANCLQCHAAGGVKPFPANHAGRTVDTCQSCHKPQS